MMGTVRIDVVTACSHTAIPAVRGSESTYMLHCSDAFGRDGGHHLSVQNILSSLDLARYCVLNDAYSPARGVARQF